MKFIDRAKRSLQTDQNWKQANYLLRTGTKAAPSASAKYLLDKVPIVGWLPRYNPRWILNDLIAGLTLGIMLIPQGLAYAKIATIPVQYGLMASWLPGILYTFMGTSKGRPNPNFKDTILMYCRFEHWPDLTHRPTYS